MMTSLKMWCLLSLCVLLSIAPTLSEVLQAMTQCEGFLLGEKSPEVPKILEKGEIQQKQRYKAICQTYKNVSTFVTLYDTKNKIPVLSAYKYTGAEGGRPKKDVWKIEPQLEDSKSNKNIKESDRANYNNQASDNNYINNENYSRGHLFPSSYARDRNGKESTCTLTNIVPQVQDFNENSWYRMESCVKCVLDRHCRNNNDDPEAYLLTGAQPGTKKLNNKVNIPTMLWSAFCCYNQTNRKWLASAFWANNVEDKSPNVYVATRTLQQLYDKLSTGSKTFNAFPGGQNCPLQETVAQLYPALNRKCYCQRPHQRGG
ncbi:Endonuclease domain-containing 1 protein [Channa argus]|uniref:Endonuclease domain-containing 1 protein n=1 Tax=Channa argus TaxID=215402 RepID=A0A6G1Q6A9_CHAAH|nr:Endonuclease domain-containing 1 protein [Channa argus]KAK2899618.1 hypothetical protein Q8A73_012747 [Channa argus]